MIGRKVTVYTQSCTCRAPAARRTALRPRRPACIPRRVREREGTSVQQRVERSTPGRALLSVFVLSTIVAIAVINLPDSHLKRSLSQVTLPYANALGLDQAWGVFAPDPRRESIALEVEITYPDGAKETWRPPERDAVIGTYSDYRWRKLMENAIVQGDGPIARDLALWVVREKRTREERPSTVVMIKRSRMIPPPGPEPATAPSIVEDRFLQLPIRPEDLRR